MLKVKDLHVYYGVIHAIKGISLEVNEGEIVTLIGANGAGKTTIMRTISGLLSPKQGSIELLEEDITKLPAPKRVGRGLCQVPEGRRIFADMTVQENLDMGAYLRKGDTKKELDNIFERFPILESRRKQMAGTLSGGEQQMLAMGRALMSKPKILLLDEPSMGLAPLLVKQVFDIIRDINVSGTTILLVEQNANMALSIADKAYVLETGKIVSEGSGAELMNSEDIKKAYLGH